MSGTMAKSSLSPYAPKMVLRCSVLYGERTTPRTEKPASRKAFIVHTAMKPFAPVTNTFPEEIAGIVGILEGRIIVHALPAPLRYMACSTAPTPAKNLYDEYPTLLYVIDMPLVDVKSQAWGRTAQRRTATRLMSPRELFDCGILVSPGTLGP